MKANLRSLSLIGEILLLCMRLLADVILVVCVALVAAAVSDARKSKYVPKSKR